ncbi:C40 family peptidase [Xanthobacter sp. TB0139]|uniref:C40 family peptidase n=1 Tax=Xanthobacter sp. TB0139 TaxID=3459178 RepID=UPI004039ECDB
MELPEGYDRRLTPAREDLAATTLRGIIEVPYYVEGQAQCVISTRAPLRRHPRGDAGLETEALCGEAVTLYEESAEGWSFVQLGRDGYVGYMPADALGPVRAMPTHKVSALRSFVFPGADIKLPPAMDLCFSSPVAVREMRGAFAVTDQGFIPAVHLAPLEAYAADTVDVALRFLGVPYLWGGRSSLGIDCSGLVQTALMACGIPAPRDSDMQEKALGQPVALEGPFRRGDLLFWPGHVGLVENETTLLHANAFHMAVVRETLPDALARIAAAGTALRSARRLEPDGSAQAVKGD